MTANLRIIIAVLLFSSTYSCQKEEATKPDDNPIAVAQGIFEQKQMSTPVALTGGSFLADPLLESRDPDWSAAFQQQKGDTLTVFVPIRFPFAIRLYATGQEGISLEGLIYLRITFAEEEHRMEMLTLIPTTEWRTGEPFRGGIVIEDWFSPQSNYYVTMPSVGGRPVLSSGLQGQAIQAQSSSNCIIYKVCVGELMTSLPPQLGTQLMAVETLTAPDDTPVQGMHAGEICHTNQYCPPGGGGPGPGDWPYQPFPGLGGSGPGKGSPAGPSVRHNPPSETQLLDQLENQPFALFEDVPCEVIQEWVATAKHQVGQAQLDKLNEIVRTTTMRPGITTTTVARLQDINNAYSTVVNMDYFSVTINQLPVVNGQRLNAERFLNYIRKDINSFINTTYTVFTPYHWYGVDEANLWNSSNPLGAVIGLDISGPDNGSVIVSHFSTNKWTFSTIFDPKYGMHPVSGHRDFGYTQNSDGSYTFYTRGVDRLADMGGHYLQALTDFPFNQADALWTSFIEEIRLFVDQNGDSASRAFVEIERPDWQKIKDVIDGKAPLSTLSKDCPD